MARARKAQLTHLDTKGSARMVDVGAKRSTRREAVATARVRIGDKALGLIASGSLPKGDVFAVARIAGITAAKRTAELIPLCHPLPIDAVEVEVEAAEPDTVLITSRARTHARTGVEMEALTAASVAALAVYDMCKSVDKGIEIGPVRLEHKSGGTSETYRRKQR